MDKFLFLYGEGWLVLVGVVDVAFQVDDIPQCGQRYLAEHSLHVAQVAVFSAWIVLAEIIVDGIVQRVDALLHARHVDVLVHLQHFLKEGEIDILQLHEVGILTYDAVAAQKLNALVPLTGQFTCQVVSERQPLPVLEESMQQLSLPVQGTYQFVERTEMRDIVHNVLVIHFYHADSMYLIIPSVRISYLVNPSRNPQRG